jgi:enoyl-CoA hydratase/carnithine racemase
MMDKDTDTIHEEHNDAVVVLTMNAPARRNALSLAMRQRLTDRLLALDRDSHVRAIVLTGTGGHFCSGADLSEAAPTDLGEARERMMFNHALVRALVGCSKPIVAAVQGFAAGAGMSLALCCDLVVAGEHARFVASFGNVGLIGDLGLLRILPRRVGEAWARRILLLGEVVEASTAERIGLVNVVASGADTRRTALEWAARLATRAPLALAATKALLNDGLETILRRELDTQAALLLTEDFAEGRAAFAAKRQPVFQGR